MKIKFSLLDNISFRKILASLLLLLFLLGSCEKGELPSTPIDPNDPTLQGYYKDLFMDGGILLTSRTTLPAANTLGLSMEYFASSATENLNLQDTLRQTALFIGDENDSNGVLLYPDGAPRFKVIYVNGGKSWQHGKSLTEEGLQRVRDYVAAGGSYVGTCAGMFMACNSSYAYGNKLRPEFFRIWPGYARHTGLDDAETGHFIEHNSPLLKYYNFGNDMYIDAVRHNGGGFLYEPWGVPAGTEILLRYDYPQLSPSGVNFHRQPSAWAYKANRKSGRIVVIGSHPEGINSGERLDLMSAMLLYALEGAGDPQLKGDLVKGTPRTMDKKTEDKAPLYTKIGDRQYHHFKINIPSGAKNIVVTLEGPSDYQLNLFMRRGSFAFAQNATHYNNNTQSKKSIKLESVEEGVWYISAYCATAVKGKKADWGTEYIGDLGVLNGVPYTIKVDWE